MRRENVVTEFPSVELVTAHKYTQKQELDIKKDRYLHFPMSTGLAIYAVDFIEKNRGK
jgi:hypothetical protein